MEVRDSSIKINWDFCLNLGEIDNNVQKVFKDKENHYMVFQNETVLFTEFKGDFCRIILEKFKDLFGINKTGTHIAKYNKKNIVINRIENTMNIKRYLYENNTTVKKLPISIKKEVQKIIAFKWIFCMKSINEKTIYIRTKPDSSVEVLSFNENSLSFYKDILSTRLIKDWFENGFEGLYFTCKELIDDRDISYLRLQIQKIIETYDRDLISWSNEIFKRLLSFY
jgi:hypothetical protein